MINFFTNKQSTLIAGIGSALVDICLLEEESFITESGARKGGMVLADKDFIASILGKSARTPAIVPGGSACNTILGVGKLGGKARFIGKRGTDKLGDLFEKELRNHNVEPVLFLSPSPTGHVLSIITPDAQRSMFTFLGASSEAKPGEILADHFKDAAVVHIEGYLLFNESLMMAALKTARECGAKISLDLASFTVVESSRRILDEITNQYVDILIANEDEARAFTGFGEEDKALAALSEKASIAVLKLGKRGSLVSCKGLVTKVDPVGELPPLDTTGAGDLWAAGFLYGLVHGYPIEKCGEIASTCGYEVCQVIGANIPEEGWERIRALL